MVFNHCASIILCDYATITKKSTFKIRRSRVYF